MSAGTGIGATDLSASRALRQAIGEYEPALETQPEAELAGIVTATPGQTLGAERQGAGETAGSPVASRNAAAPLRQAQVVEPTGQATDASPEGVVASAPYPAGTDLSVHLPVSEPVEAGDVLVADRDRPGSLRRGDTPGDAGVVGVVSAVAPAQLGEVEGATVALAGIVQCKADATYGAIQIGDLLTVSPNAGHAMRADLSLPGTVVGKALESLGTGTGHIKVLVMLR